MELITIKSDKLEAVIAPSLGGSIYSFKYKKDSTWLDIMRPTPQVALEKRDAGGFASFHLIPYSNRIEGGKLKFKGETYSLKTSDEGHSIHGDIMEREWTVLSKTEAELLLSFDSRDFDDMNWPFPFTAKMGFGIKGGMFTTFFNIKNVGDSLMPAGLGTHPYFLKKLTDADDDVYVTLPMLGLYPGNTTIPTGTWITIPPHMDFSKERALDSHQFIDNCFRANKGTTTIRWPGSGVTLSMDADSSFDHLVFFTPLDKSFFAIEPVTNCNNGFNMAEEGIQDTGTVILDPNEKLYGTVLINIEG